MHCELAIGDLFRLNLSVLVHRQAPMQHRRPSLQRRIISRVQVDRFNFFYKLAIFLRCLLQSLPLWVSQKILPTLRRCFLAGECEQINELALRLLRIGWNPKPDNCYLVLLKEFTGVVAESSLQSFHLAWYALIGSQLKNSTVH